MGWEPVFKKKGESSRKQNGMDVERKRKGKRGVDKTGRQECTRRITAEKRKQKGKKEK